MRTVAADGYDEPRDALAQLWPQFLAAALPNADWLFVPSLGAMETSAYCERWGINGLILTGGEDVGTSPLRDRSEHALLVWAAEKSLPLLGVCRGMQLMSTASGAGLSRVSGHVAVRHCLHGDYDWEVNSYHTATLAEVPKQYRVLAKAPDGSIEAIRHDTLPWEGWMWHPEREAPYSSNDICEIRRMFQ